MKLTTGIVALALSAGAWGQNPATILQNTKTAMQGVQAQKTADSDAALQATGTPAAKPSAAGPKQTSAPKQSAAPAVAPAPAKTATASVPAAKPAVVKPAAVKPATANPFAVKPAVAQATPKSAVKVVPAKTATAAAAAAPAKVKVAAAKPAVAPTQPKPAAAASAAPEAAKSEKQEDKKYSMTGKRDPFISPVVNRAGGSGCSTGKKCLDIDQIAVRGVVKSDNGMIAVVTNGLNKAYFLRENDPVFNGYVVKITVDSVVFKQNFQDRLGKPFTKDVVKRITTPAV